MFFASTRHSFHLFWKKKDKCKKCIRIGEFVRFSLLVRSIYARYPIVFFFVTFSFCRLFFRSLPAKHCRFQFWTVAFTLYPLCFPCISHWNFCFYLFSLNQPYFLIWFDIFSLPMFCLFPSATFNKLHEHNLCRSRTHTSELRYT